MSDRKTATSACAWAPKGESERFVPLAAPFDIAAALRPFALRVVSNRAIELRPTVEFSDDGTTWIAHHDEIEHRTA